MNKTLIKKGNVAAMWALSAGLVAVFVGAININLLSRKIWASDTGFKLIHMPEAFMIEAEVILSLAFCVIAVFIASAEKNYKYTAAFFAAFSRLAILGSLTLYNFRPNPVRPKTTLLLIERVLSYRSFLWLLFFALLQGILFAIAAYFFHKAEVDEEVVDEEK